MDQPFSLEYYDRIFGRRGPEFWELVSALSEELEKYAQDLGQALRSRDRESFTRLRHTYRPVVLNLDLTNLRALETEIAQAFATEEPAEMLAALASQFHDEAQDIARVLSQIRFG